MDLSEEKPVCRSCLFTGESMKNLFQGTLRDVFIDATKIEVSENDGLPSWLCNYCYSLVLKIIRFKLLASKTDKILKRTKNTDNINFNTNTNFPFGMLSCTTISQSKACKNCSNIPNDNHINDKNQNMNIFYFYDRDITTEIEIIDVEVDNFKSKNNIYEPIEEKYIKTERFEDNALCNFKSNYSTENDDSCMDEVIYTSSNPERKRKKHLQSEHSPLDLKANAFRITRKVKKKIKRNIKMKKSRVKVSENLKNAEIQLEDKSLSVESSNTLNIKTERENRILLGDNIILQDFKRLPKLRNKIKTDKMFDDTKSTKKSYKKRSKIDRIKSSMNQPNTKELSGKIENDSMVLLNCDMSRVAVIEMTLDEQMKELKSKQDSEQFKSARYKCDRCIKVFPYEDSFKNHLMRHEKSYGCCECSVCGQRFLTSRVLKSHQMAHAKRYRCLECNRILKFKATVTHHMMRHDGTYSCRVCGHLSINKEANKVHQRTHTHQVTYNCPICPRVLGTKQDYRIHMRRHSGDMPFECAECAKTFLTNAALQSHRAVHSSARHYYCADCDVSFKTKDIMLTHFKKSLRHVDPALLRFECDLCPKRFPTKEALVSHSDSYHTRCVKLACDVCPAQFVTTNGLRNHRRTVHEGYRPSLTHVCEACGRAFSTKALVTNHLRTHTGEQPFECPTCQRRFSQRSAMQTHIKLVHLKIKRNMSIPKDKPQKPMESELRVPVENSLFIPAKIDAPVVSSVESITRNQTIQTSLANEGR